MCAFKLPAQRVGEGVISSVALAPVTSAGLHPRGSVSLHGCRRFLKEPPCPPLSTTAPSEELEVQRRGSGWRSWGRSCLRLFTTDPWNSPGKNTEVGCQSLPQGIFLTQGSNLGLLHCRQILYHLSHKRNPVPTAVVFRSAQHQELQEGLLK